MDIRKKFLDYFKSKGHAVVPSSPLVPNDDSLLFTNAGMVQFKKIFTGEEPIPNPPRATSSQLCVRAGGKHNDLDNVGYTARHHTLFEMLGNFSFADYFKKEAIAYAWEFVTAKEHLGLDAKRLYATVHESDDEAYKIWQTYLPKERIYKFGDKDNFWQMGDTGPCGPCSEIFYDQGAEHFSSPEDVMGGEGDRFLEIWNLVFMQYERDEQGELHPLPKPSIDTGMGLERVVAIKEGVLNNYHSSLFIPYLNKIGELVGKPYDESDPKGASYRVIADHLRSTAFLLAQGVTFDKEGRGYVLRRIMRRAIRHGYLLGLKEPFMYELVDVLTEVMGEAYPYLKSRSASIKEAMRLEEERFFETIESGIKLFNEELSRAGDTFSGEVAFKLYDTYGFPLDLTQDMLREKGIALDIEGFEAKMAEQKERSRANWQGSGADVAKGDFKALLEEFGTNTFVGYDTTVTQSKVSALLDTNFKRTRKIKDEGWVLLEPTPFYAESGGQVGDSGELIKNDGGRIKVVDTKKFQGLILSKVEGALQEGEEVEAKVSHKRAEIAKHHSATHLLHSALREVLGEHVSQAGSYNDESKLRFDFTHPKALSREELKKIEAWVNDKVARALPQDVEETTPDEAIQKGAIALFGEKYGDKVRVVRFGDASVELCGGTHVPNSAYIGEFIITKEGGVSAGVRRIEAVCGRAANRYVNTLRDEVDEAKSRLKSSDLLQGIEKLKAQNDALKEELKAALKSSKKELSATKIGDVTVVIDEIGAGDIKAHVDEIKNRFDKVAVMLFQKKGEKVVLAAGSKGVNVHAGEWVKKIAPLLGGGGGGRPDFAQAGGKDASKIEEAKQEAIRYLKEVLQGA